ncbi:tyrosine-type recombinase/integrase [Ilumatobacter sp.]|uniref:tyrosine-type recombinase/integrase n=1 Tax=Ilumatobacter sp. TaxID=1967498 RepID=UPI003753E577
MTVKKDAERGTWYFVVELPAVAGKRQQLKRRGFPTKKAAQAEFDQVSTESRKGSFVRPMRGTVAEYLVDIWLPSKRSTLRPSTIVGYEKVVNRRLVPLIGEYQLAALDAAAVEVMYGELLSSGGVGGAPLSAKTVANAGGVLSKALRDAVRLKRLAYNVSADAELPARVRPEQSTWTADEATRFLAATTDDRPFPMWRLALSTGMRRGELCGLRWRDLDLDDGRATIASTRVVAREVVTGEPKTKAGNRVVRLDAETINVLRAWRKRTNEERLVAGAAWIDTGLVFVDALGEPPHPETVTRWWRKACEAAGLPVIRLHDARHTAATLMLRDGVPVKVVSQRLGHADIAVTMRVYQHVTAQDDQLAADVLGSALGGKT